MAYPLTGVTRTGNVTVSSATPGSTGAALAGLDGTREWSEAFGDLYHATRTAQLNISAHTAGGSGPSLSALTGTREWAETFGDLYHATRTATLRVTAFEPSGTGAALFTWPGTGSRFLKRVRRITGVGEAAAFSGVGDFVRDVSAIATAAIASGASAVMQRWNKPINASGATASDATGTMNVLIVRFLTSTAADAASVGTASLTVPPGFIGTAQIAAEASGDLGRRRGFTGVAATASGGSGHLSSFVQPGTNAGFIRISP